MSQAEQSKSYELNWRFSNRLITQHLGSQKYATSSRAMGELVANGFDAGATTVSIDIRFNDLGGAESIVISDNGVGISPSHLKDRFMELGVAPDGEQRSRIGKFGIGRMAVHRIGTLSEWTSVSGEVGHRVQINFTLRSEPGPLLVKERRALDTERTGTRIEIFNLLDSGQEALTPKRIADHLLVQYCRYLLGNPAREIRVQGEGLNVTQLVSDHEIDTIPPSDNVPTEARIDHLILNRPVDHSRFPEQLLFSGKGGTLAGVRLDEPPAPSYLGLVECAYLDDIVSSNREGVIQMDEGFTRLRTEALERVSAFSERYRLKQAKRFIEQARQAPSYPYRGVPADSVSVVEQAVYDVTLEKLNEAVRIDRMNAKQQAVIFKLWQRAITNENFFPILSDLLDLNDEDVEKFRRVLEHTKLDSIIKLASEVTNRLRFLDALQELAYGEISKRIKERAQLHRIIETHCWMFGPKYHLAASDQQFRTVIGRHRELAGFDPLDEDALRTIVGVENIPDLFLAAERDFPSDPPNPSHHRLLVELKRPSVCVGLKEIEQVKKYARTTAKSAEFDQSSTHWDVFVVSAEISKDIQEERNQKNRPHGCVADYDNVTVFAYTWGEVIEKARDDMKLVRQHLERKSQEMNVSEYLRQNFPDIVL